MIGARVFSKPSRRLSSCGDPTFCLTIAGDGPERLAAEAMVQSRRIDGVTFVGHIDGAKKRKAFQNADIYLFTSLAEGMPNSVLEAMALACQ